MLEGRKVLGPEEKLYEGFPGIAYLSQHFELRNNYWVYEVLEYANKLSNSEAAELYALCRIDHLLKRRTHELSGGERQRIPGQLCDTRNRSICIRTAVRQTRRAARNFGDAPARHSFTPLYSAGLWLAVNIAPGRFR